VTDLNKFKKFLDDDYRISYLDSHVNGSIAYQIQALREALGLNQTDFGALVGMPQSVISRLESGEGGGVNVNTLLRIANGLKIGLAVKFCDFAAVMAEDVSPAALLVENIGETVNRLVQAKPQAPISSANVIVVVVAPSSESNHTWQIPTIPEQAGRQQFRGAGTRSIGMSTQTPATLP